MIGTAKPKLLVFSHICNPVLVTGGERVLSLFLGELAAHYECVLVVPEFGAIARKAKAAGIRTVVLDIPLVFSLYTGSATVAQDIENLTRQPIWRTLHALLLHESPDAVMVNTSVHPLPAIAAYARGIPTVWLVMETLYDTPHRDRCADIIASHCDIVVGMSQTVLKPFHAARKAKAKFVLSPFLEREELVPDVWGQARTQFRKLYRWTEQHCVVGFIAATIYPNKGQTAFIEAMLPIAEEVPHARFLIVGAQMDEGHSAACRASIARAGFEDRFVFCPFVEHVHQVYPAMDVVVVPSLVPEGFGMTALEGMMFGKAVVAYSSGGLGEIMNATGNERFLVPTGDVAGLTERVRWLTRDEGYRAVVAMRNEEAATRAFGAAGFREKLAQLIGLVDRIPKDRPPNPVPLFEEPVAPRSAPAARGRGKSAGRKRGAAVGRKAGWRGRRAAVVRSRARRGGRRVSRRGTRRGRARR